MGMLIQPLEAQFTEFSLSPGVEPRDATVAIPVSNGMQQRYFFTNLRTQKGLAIRYPRRGGLTTADAATFLHHLCSFTMNHDHKVLPRLRTLLRRYHNGISFLELLFKVSKPHGVTYIGDQRYLISLWSSSTYFVIDLRNQTIELQMLSAERDEVFSTYQFFDPGTRQTYFATQLGVHEWHKHDKEDIDFPVPIKIRKYDWATGELSNVWEGVFDTDTHYLMLNQDRTMLGLVQFGDFYGHDGKLLPSKILILDLESKKEWWIDNTGWEPSAHIDWDPVDPKVCYLSCHNGVIGPVKSPLRFFFEKVYHWNIYGNASVHRYEITESGPKKTGIFTHPDVYRLTIHKVFVHRGKKLIACTGFPNLVFIVDAESMELIRKVTLAETSGTRCVLGSLFPTPDGEKVCLATTRSFQMLDVATGRVERVHGLGRVHDPFNHMTVVADTDW